LFDGSLWRPSQERLKRNARSHPFFSFNFSFYWGLKVSNKLSGFSRTRAAILTETTGHSPAAKLILAAAPLFADLPEAIIDAVAEQSSLRHFGGGETVFAAGQFDGAEIVYLASGRMKASRADPASGSMIVEEITPGSFFALALSVLPANAVSLSDFSISAEEAADAVLIDAEGLRGLVAQRPLLARCLLQHFAKASVGSGAAYSGEAAPDRRVFAAIAAMVRRDAVEATWRIDKMPKHRDLANLANVAEADAASAVARLIVSGVARRDYPGLVIDDMPQLNRLAR
jgi:CRP-like cAMP-binding protein